MHYFLDPIFQIQKNPYEDAPCNCYDPHIFHHLYLSMDKQL